jgi:hypothetical protein
MFHRLRELYRSDSQAEKVRRKEQGERFHARDVGGEDSRDHGDVQESPMGELREHLGVVVYLSDEGLDHDAIASVLFGQCKPLY